MIRKFLISSVIAGATLFLLAFIGDTLFPYYPYDDNPHEKAFYDGIDASILIIAVITFIVSFYKVTPGKSGREMTLNVLNTVKDIHANLELKDADLYAVAEKEYESGQINQGLWSQALVKAKGNEALRKVEYMKLRVMQLKQK